LPGRGTPTMQDPTENLTLSSCHFGSLALRWTPTPPHSKSRTHRFKQACYRRMAAQRIPPMYRTQSPPPPLQMYNPRRPPPPPQMYKPHSPPPPLPMYKARSQPPPPPMLPRPSQPPMPPHRNAPPQVSLSVSYLSTVVQSLIPAPSPL
jgi:hypothetical protein